MKVYCVVCKLRKTGIRGVFVAIMSISNWRKQREDRLRRVNALIQVIAVTGRKFFRHGYRTGRMEMDYRGRLWWLDEYTSERLPLSVKPIYALRRRFSHGGTMRCLVLAFKGFVMTGNPIHPMRLGPWPDGYCGGDLWGYGEDMKIVRQMAHSLGIIG